MKRPDFLERTFKSKTKAFVAALRAGEYDEAVSISSNRHGLVKEIVAPEIESAFQIACDVGQCEKAAQVSSILWPEGQTRALAQRGYDRNFDRARFKDASKIAAYFELPVPTGDRLKEVVSAGYRKALAEFRFVDAKQCVCPHLDLISDTNQAPILELLLDAAALVASQGMSQWMPYLPGHPKFKCIPDVCNADCCRRTDRSIPLTKREVQIIRSRTRLAEKDFTTQMQGYKPSTHLPSLQKVSEPKGCKCKFLSSDNRCQIHEFRPAGCVKYPYTVFPIGRHSDGKLEWSPPGKPAPYLSDEIKAREAVWQLNTGNTWGVHFFVLVGYDAKGCPGFSNDEISMQEYMALMDRQFELYVQTDWSFLYDQ